jgi:hypothetical protein
VSAKANASATANTTIHLIARRVTVVPIRARAGRYGVESARWVDHFAESQVPLRPSSGEVRE